MSGRFWRPPPPMTIGATRRATILLSACVLAGLLVATVEAVGSASTVAISHGTGTVCGIRSSTKLRSVVCARGSETFSLLPNVSFHSISGGRDFFCGLRSGGTSFFCWNLGRTSETPPSSKRIYHNYHDAGVLQELNVGETQISAVRSGTGILWWRGRREFPAKVDGNYTSLTSGDGFTCAIGVNDSRVHCWGENRIRRQMESDFANISMSTIVAGGAHACGRSTDGVLICKGHNESGQLGLQSGASPFEFSGLALGANHTCGISRIGRVVCWGNGHASPRPAPIGNVVAIVAGGNLTCGVMSKNLSVVCWASDTTPPQILPLPRTLPGLCRDKCPSTCQVLPDSEGFCSGSGVICGPCDGGNSPPPPAPPSREERTSKGMLAFAVVGSVGAVAGICTFVYWAVTRFCMRKKVHNSVQPTIAGTSNGSRNNSPPTAASSVFVRSLSNSMKSKSMSSVFRRQESRMMKRQRSGTSTAAYGERPEEFTFEELGEATNNFSSDAKIGGGSFGTVYRGKLPDGREVAIKRSETGNKAKKFQEKEDAFLSELAFLSRLHHKHLVGFVGFCEDDDERLLVYEYMENGALYDHLHRNNNGGVLNSWRMRIKILQGAARGVDYLHNYAVPPIIHRDIKSSNILLDANWTARVSDFGLSLIGTGSDGTHLNMKAAGTVGYMDPEYYGLHHLTPKSDVYGLGVVMLEVLTGKRAIFKDEEGMPTSVVDHVVPRLSAGDTVAGLLDTRLVGTAAEIEAVELVAYTAVHCVRLEGKDRPSITDVVANLETALAICDDSGERQASDTSVDLVSID